MSLEPVPRRIALVEDDLAVLNSLHFMFTAAGYSVFGFENGTSALASPQTSTVDCLVIDYALPDCDGLSLLRRLRRAGVACPAVLIVSTPTPRCRQQAREDGVPLMEKPLVGDNLGAWVDMLITDPGVAVDQ